MPPIIEVNHVWKAYQKGIDRRYKSLRDTLVDIPGKLFGGEKELFWALEDINFNVAAGESVGIIGRNGAGKSTLLKILSRITPPTKGEIILRGRVASLLEVGTGFHPELTGRENVFFNGSILGMKHQEIKKKFDEIVEFSGVERFIDTPLKHYSSGMQMRLAFSVAAHLDAEILLIDEVLAVGDAEFQKKCIGKMDEVSKGDGKTILFVSHDVAQIRNLCQKGILLNGGRIFAQNDLNDVIFHYSEDLIKSEKLMFENDKIGNPGIKSCQIISEVRCGKPLVFILQIICNTRQTVDIALGIRNIENQPILHIYSFNSNYSIKLHLDLTILKIEIPNLSLTPGWYSINLWLGKGDLGIEFHRQCIFMYVKEGKLFEEGPLITFKGYNNVSNANWTTLI